MDAVARLPADEAESLSAVALQLRPAVGHLRVVDIGASAAQPYLEVGARVAAVGFGTLRDRAGVHVHVDWDDARLPLRTRDTDLVLWDEPIDESTARSRLPAVLGLLAPGGCLVFRKHPTLHSGLRAAGLEVADVLDRPQFAIAADPRPPHRLPAGLQGIDRTSCVDRDLLLQAYVRAPFEGPRTTTPADVATARDANTSLVMTLREQLRTGDPDPDALPWPEVTASSADADTEGCDVLVLMPHPDDESVYVGGTLAGLATAGQRVRLVVATDGAGGRGGDDLARRRAAEVLDACATLGIQGVQCLGWRDTGKYRDTAKQRPATSGDAIRAWGLDAALDELVAVIRTHRPRVILSLDPRADPNLSLHGHHLGLALLAAVAFHRAADPSIDDGREPWAVGEHRVVAPAHHAGRSDAFEFDRVLKRDAVRAHRSQQYSTRRILRELEDADSPVVEYTRSIQARRDSAWLLVRASGRVPCDAGIDWAAQAQRVLVRSRPRTELADLMRSQAVARRADDAVLANIERLRDPNTVAVLTGQQVGVLGGPAFTLTKALSAVALARRLTRQGIEAVPVFWMATQDHDAAEVSRIPELEGGTSRVNMLSDGGAVGRQPLGPHVDAAIEDWLASPALVHEDDVQRLLRRTHEPEQTFAGAFADLFGELTRGTGLIFLDPDEDAFATLARPVLRRELLGPTRAAAPLEQARARLGHETIPTERDVLQVFFYDERGRRHRLRPTPNGAAYGKTELDRETIESILETEPRRFSPAALLRPVVQDFVLPAVAYVGGPTEVRYLAQTDELHDWAETPAARVIARPVVDPISAVDAATLHSVGGPGALRADPQPFNTLGRTGLEPAERHWLDDLEELMALAQDRADGVATRDEELTRSIRDLASRGTQTLATDRLRETWGGSLGIGTQLLSSEAEAPLRGDSVRWGRVAQLLRRMRAAVLRDGRRRVPKLVEAWGRVTTDPAPLERRMTSAELVSRFGAQTPGAILAALETSFPQVVELRTGGRA